MRAHVEAGPAVLAAREGDASFEAVDDGVVCEGARAAGQGHAVVLREADHGEVLVSGRGNGFLVGQTG